MKVSEIFTFGNHGHRGEDHRGHRDEHNKDHNHNNRDHNHKDKWWDKDRDW